MGVHGLLSKLAQHATPRPVTLLPSAKRAGAPKVLLVDGSSLWRHLAAPLGGRATPAQLYAATRVYVARMAAVGLRLVVCSDTATEPGHEATQVARVRALAAAPEGASMSPDAGAGAFGTALLDGGAEVLRAAVSADDLLYAFYKQNASSVFALLTPDSDFFVLGVERIVLTHDVNFEPGGGVTFQMWSSAAAWAGWRSAVGGRAGAAGSGAAISLLQRAQVAALLGNDKSKDVRARLSSRHASSAAGVRVGVASPIVAAGLALAQPGDRALGAPFFRDTLKLKGFGAEQLETFQSVAAAYVEAATGAAPWQAHLLTAETAPWLTPRGRELLVGPLLSYEVGALAVRGWAVALDHGPPVVQRLRGAAIAELFAFGPPGDVLLCAPDGSAMTRLLAARAGSTPPATWFAPAALLGVPVVEAAARDSLAAAVDFLRARAPSAPLGRLINYAALARLAAGLEPDLAERRAYLKYDEAAAGSSSTSARR
jgi:hypothetical protein